ncbi:DNA polymerase [Megamonas hypermegale]|uniref:DNA polymerase n=1 Tax=Megamonas hypermegale TaxID=158847 RepID=UPI00195AEA38|nr:DNA polymerase [Megamonas hypermegale]MBM6833861.1 hypothetical protein [Megamonas hypermegale]
MKILSIDLETYSDLDIKAVGGYKYAENAEILLFGYACDDEPVQVIDLAQGEEIPANIIADISNPAVLKTAYNAQFERTVLSHYLFDGYFLDPNQWQCTMVLSLNLGLYGSLAEDCKIFKMPEDKAKLNVGRKLIMEFCKPCSPTKTNGGRTRNLPQHDIENWNLFKEYNKRDVEVERYLRKKMIPFKPPEVEHKLWALDQNINDRGITVDVQLISKAIAADFDFKTHITAEAKKISGLDNPNSTEQLKKWIEEQEGFFPPSITKDTVKELLKIVKNKKVHEMLKLKMLLSKTSIKKYTAMQKARCNDGKVRGLLQFYGANRTGRWAGRLVQVQNLPRNTMPDLDDARELLKSCDAETFEIFYENVPNVLSQLIRTAFIPSKGNKFIVADFSAIEARVIAWLSNENWRMDVFANGGDIYCASASQMFHVPVVKHGINGELRQKGKIAELALGYQGGIGALKAMGADKMGLTDSELTDIVAKWRKASPNIVKLWNEVEKAVVRAVEYRTSVAYKHNMLFSYKSGMLRIRLASGRVISYIRPQCNYGKLSYEGINQTSRKWERLDTYGGKLVENIVQATARDCLAVAMMRLNDAGFKIVMHVHDEVIIDCKGTNKELNEINKIMGEPIDWASGLILNADGYITDYYKKD